MSKKKKKKSKKQIKAVLSEVELAARWGVSKITLRRWREKGEGPKYFQVGSDRKTTYYTVTEVIKYEQGDA